MEMLDVYDEDFKKIGKTVSRGTRLTEGHYVLCTHIIIQDMSGKFLVQQRSANKRSNPNAWDITAGAVDAGEDSQSAAIREAKEEVGLTVPREQMRFVFRDKVRDSYHEMWFVQMDFDLSDCTMQESEVQALKLVDAEEMYRIACANPLRSQNYKDQVKAFLMEMGAI